jgi:hypothetical protein
MPSIAKWTLLATAGPIARGCRVVAAVHGDTVVSLSSADLSPLVLRSARECLVRTHRTTELRRIDTHGCLKYFVM